MASVAPRHLSPRKRPIQARAAVTLDAIFEATIQLLVADGPHRLTTTRVAKRAGVSIGTMYQYFPHKQALLYALNERYLVALSERIEATCHAHHGRPIGVMVEALVDTYWRAKNERADVTRALYRTAVELDNETLIETFADRVNVATTFMLASASDAVFGDLSAVNLTLVTVIFGAVRNAFERDLTSAATDVFKRHLLIMCQAYLQAASSSHSGVAAAAEGG